MPDHGDQILDAAFPEEVNDVLNLDDHAIKLRKIWLQSFHATLDAGAIGGGHTGINTARQPPAGLHVIGPALPIDGKP